MTDLTGLDPRIREMVKWSVHHPTPGENHAGWRRIMGQYPAVSRTEAERIAKIAREAGFLPEFQDGAPQDSQISTDNLLFDPLHPAFRLPILEKLKANPVSLREMAGFLGISEGQALDMLRSLKSAGWMVEEIEGRWQISGLSAAPVPEMKSFKRLRQPTQKFGIISDTHVGSSAERLDVMEMAYEEFEREGIDTVFLPGNIVDGYKERINGGEVLFRNCTDQCMYLADVYPQREGIKTYFITAHEHEGWWRKAIGLEIGHYIEMVCQRSGRNDLVFAGHLERDFQFGSNKEGEGVILRLFHPGGGTSYATSYQPQKIVEAYQGGTKPNILLIGHFHKAGWFYPRNVHTLLAGCTQDQTVWMRSKHIQAHVGFFTLEFSQDEGGAVASFAPRFYPFYDTDYHLDAGEWSIAISKALSKKG